MSDFHDLFGFSSEDLAANRQGRFSAGQQAQFQAMLRTVRRPLLSCGAVAATTVTLVVILLAVVFGDTPVTRLISVGLSGLLFIYLTFAVFFWLNLGRTHARLRVNQASGTIKDAPTHATDEDGVPTLQIDVSGVPFYLLTSDAAAATALLSPGTQWTVYFIGTPPNATVLSFERH